MTEFKRTQLTHMDHIEYLWPWVDLDLITLDQDSETDTQWIKDTVNRIKMNTKVNKTLLRSV